MALRETLSVPLPRFKLTLPPLAVSLGIAWIVLMIGVAATADILTPYSITAFDLKARLSEPLQSLNHPLGTDELGRDLLSRLLYGGRITLGMVLAVVVLALFVGRGPVFFAATLSALLWNFFFLFWKSLFVVLLEFFGVMLVPGKSLTKLRCISNES